MTVENLKTILETIKLRKNLDRLKQELHLAISDEQLYNAIEVRPGNRNEIIQILTTADQPDQAARMANSISQIFQDSSSQISCSVAERVYQFRRDQKQALQKELYQAQGQLAAFQQKHQVSFYQDTTRILLEQIKQLELDQTNAMTSKISSFDIVEFAQIPTEPLPSGRKLQLLFGILAGLLLGLGLPLALELLDLRIKSPKQIKANALDYLGLLPYRRANQSKYYPYWLLFINRFLLRLSHLGGKPQIILVTSPKAQDGKHFVSEQILDTFRFRGQNVVHIRPLQEGETASYDLSTWLQHGEELLPFPLYLDKQVQVYTTQFGALENSRPLLMHKFTELLERHQQVDVILWELPPMIQYLHWLLMIAPVASALLIVNRFRGVSAHQFKDSLAELKSLQPDLAIYGLLNQVPTAYSKLKG